MATSILSSITLTGEDLDPEQVTDALGITPTKTWRIGDPIQNTLLKRKHSGWSVATPRQVSLDLAKQVRDLLRELEPKFPAIAALRERLGFAVEVSCAIYIYGDTPSMHLDREILSMVERLGAEIDFDLYVYIDE